MQTLLTVQRTRAAEIAAVAGGTSLDELMERAGRAVASELSRRLPEGRVVVLAGKGNNGGDGWVAARVLRGAGRDVLVLTMATPSDLPQPARAAAAAAIGSGVIWRPWTDAEAIEGAVVVDALLGIGLTGAPRDDLAAAIRWARGASATLAIDIPSGVDGDTGAVPGDAVRADMTVTLGGPKAGCHLGEGRMLCGEVVVADIGLRPAHVEGGLEVPTLAELASWLPLPRFDENKWTRGTVLVIGGSPGMTGSVCLAARGALRSGAGYVIVGVPRISLPVVEVKLTAPVKAPLPCEDDGSLSPASLDAALSLARRADAVVLGMGMGRSEGAVGFARSMMEAVGVPLVIDGDGLGALASDVSILGRRTAPTVLTPHAGEAARLLGVDAARIGADRERAVRELSSMGATVVLKGPSTLIADGGHVIVNATGGPGLATLGTGDVLSGIVGALLAQQVPPLEAAALAAHVHGAAGDEAAQRLTGICCTADDVIACLPEAFRPLLAARDASTTGRIR